MGDWNIVNALLGMTLLGAEWVLWLLLILSVISLAIILQKTFYFAMIRLDVAQFMESLKNQLSSGDSSKIIQLGNQSQSPISQVVLRATENQENGFVAIEQGMNNYITSERQKLEKGLTFLGTLGNNAPFIGLLGTVIGIIKAFHDLSNNPEGGAQVVMAGISEALVATAVGLFVAIPAVIAFNVFNRMIKRKFAQAEIVQQMLLNYFKR